MKNRFPFRGKIALAASFTACIAVITAAILGQIFIPFNAETALKLGEISRHIEKDFYFSVDEDELSDSLAAGLMEGLEDEYSEYYPISEAISLRDRLSGESAGIGVATIPCSEGLYIWRVYDYAPADIAGIKSGDIITEIDGQSLLQNSAEYAVELLRGELGEKHSLSVKRGDKRLKLEVECDYCDIQTVFAEYSEENEIGVIEIISFNKKTSTQFKAAVETLSELGAKALIIDLRHNGGGTVEAAARMLDYLLPEGNILQVRYKDGKIRVRNKSDKNELNIPIAILTDSKTASASEIFCQTMRDYERATIIGSKTFGKFVIQRSYKLSDKSSVKFTIGEFVSKSGESFNKIGLTPDIEVNTADREDSSFYFMSDSEDKALNAAYDYLKQR